MHIQETTDPDLEDILFVERQAFNSNKEADRTKDMLADPTAKPLTSLIAYMENQPAGHILFTTVHLSNAPHKVSILAPLAVIPKFQRQGVGGALIKKGLHILSKVNVELVFVLKHPEYYPRHGFTPAGKRGFEAPFPIPKKDANAWMVQSLRPNVIGSVSGKIICCNALNKPEHWRE
jgi:putative acetyltransferase